MGYRVRRETRVGPATRVEVVTEGVLTRMLQADPPSRASRSSSSTNSTSGASTPTWDWLFVFTRRSFSGLTCGSW